MTRQHKPHNTSTCPMTSSDSGPLTEPFKTPRSALSAKKLSIRNSDHHSEVFVAFKLTGPLLFVISESYLMMGRSRTNEKGKAPAHANSIPSNVDGDNFDSFLDMPLWKDIHRSVVQGVPEPIGNPRVYSRNPNSLQNPQSNLNSNTTNTNLQEESLLLDWSMGWGQQDMNQGHNAISSGGIGASGSSLSFCPRDTVPVHTRNNVNFNTNQSGVQGKFEGSFLSLGLGGTSEALSSFQLDSREISDNLKEAASSELNIARARKASDQTFDGGFMGSQSNNSGFSNQFSHVSRITSTNNDDGFMGSSPHHILQMQQNDRQLGKLTEAVSTELKMVHSQKATGQTLDLEFMGSQRNNSGFSNQFSNVDRMTSTKYDVGVHSMLNSGLGSSRHHVSQMQQNDSRNMRPGDLDYYKGNKSVHSGTLGRNSAHFFSSQQHNMKPPESVKPSWMKSYHTPSEQLHHFHSTPANSPNYAGKQGQVVSQNATPTQVLGGNRLSHRTATPQVSWVGRGSAGIDAQFPKRLGVEFSVRNCPQSSQGHLSPMGTSLQTTSTGQICQFSDKGSTHMPHNVHRPIGQTDGAPVSYRVNHQEPFFTYGQSQNALIQLPKGPQGAPSTNASTVDSQSQKLDFHVGSHHKRTAAAPQSSSPWVKRQKIIHPTIHHSMPKPPVPVTAARVHPSIPVRSRTKPTGPVAGPVAAHIRSVIPCVSNARPRVPVASYPAVSHITWKDPDATSKLSGHKCFLCKRDLALTSEGRVSQPAVRPPVAILPCGHTFHDQCLQNITPDDQAKDPPCIPCAIGEN
ncbi:hypothetical protein L1987_30735 [Smallanthus sonchifolius]|uniref:Uncharacterized protein n=1 Tax=Smallanthus sonchifolius TaxID=185202 RepID=A0ACB9I4B2_9ASTR|nr:hypothetical protein L1987_30735 [Smallanthus sonchifolius]